MKNSINKKYLIHISILIIISLYGCNVDEIPPALASELKGWFTIDENNIWLRYNNPKIKIYMEKNPLDNMFFNSSFDIKSI